jgi:hypothetical protein
VLDVFGTSLAVGVFVTSAVVGTFDNSAAVGAIETGAAVVGLGTGSKVGTFGTGAAVWAFGTAVGVFGTGAVVGALRTGLAVGALGAKEEMIIQAKAQVKAAYHALRDVQRNARLIRDQFLKDRAQHLADTQNMTKAAAVHQLLRAERQCAIFHCLRTWIKGAEHVTLDRILVPDDPANPNNTNWTSIVEAQVLYEVLLSYGQRHFNQAAPTPFVTGPIAAKF